MKFIRKTNHFEYCVVANEIIYFRGTADGNYLHIIIAFIRNLYNYWVSLPDTHD